MNHSRRNLRYATLIILALVLAACSDNPVSTGLFEVSEHPAAPKVSPSIAKAATSNTASGTVIQTEITSLNVRLAGPNTMLKQSSRGVLDGTLTGSFEDELSVSIHPNGTFTTKFTLTCACMVDGKEGIVTITAADRGELVSPNLASFSGHATIKESTGELSGLRGVFDIEGTVDVPSGLSNYTYSGQIHFPPQ
ncbi:MAG TPA: hypothetical protein VKP65_26120 [Rhodothermales bacterium]|nr:hypothetical protein [Rhodothermales bacterium]